MKAPIYGVIKTRTGWSVAMIAPARLIERLPTQGAAEAVPPEWELGLKTAADLSDIWIAGDFVAEAGIEGTQLGELHEVDLRQYTIVKEVSQEGYDNEVQELFE